MVGRFFLIGSGGGRRVDTPKYIIQAQIKWFSSFHSSCSPSENVNAVVSQLLYIMYCRVIQCRGAFVVQLLSSEKNNKTRLHIFHIQYDGVKIHNIKINFQNKYTINA